MDEALLSAVKTCAKSNEQLINSIRAQEYKTFVVAYNYNVKVLRSDEDFGKLAVEERTHTTTGRKIMSTWRPCLALELSYPLDLFNDKLNFTCNTFFDIERLNAGMLAVVEKYKFLNTECAKEELKKYQRNFEIFHPCLREILALMSEPSSELDKINAELQEINSRIDRLKESGNVSMKDHTKLGEIWDSVQDFIFK